MSDRPIEINELTRKFGENTAVDNVTFSVKPGEIFGLLGPNGAGKSTLIRMLCTLSRPTAGSARVAGFDVLKQPGEVRKHIGLVAERIILYERLTAEENLLLFGRLNHMPRKVIDERIDYLLKLLNMDEWRKNLVGTFSTGMKQRLNLARALLHRPDILFLDEPTLGLDPQTTRSLHSLIKELAADGTTIILTTHIMSEAESLANRVAIIDRGKICALDTPDALKRSIAKSGKFIDITLLYPNAALLTELGKFESLTPLPDENSDGRYHLRINTPEDSTLYNLIESIHRHGVEIGSINTVEPTLEDVFLALTGREIRDGATGKATSGRFDHRARNAPKRTR
jgi:ABC-2 type transport system ATP-binding protein